MYRPIEDGILTCVHRVCVHLACGLSHGNTAPRVQLENVDYGARNRLATVFWYMSTVEGGGGETYFPRALNADGAEYKPWNGVYQ